MGIEEIIEEKIWFAKAMLKDKGKDVPCLRPLIGKINDPWEAVYFAMEELKQHLKEVNLWTDSHLSTQAEKLESQPARISKSVV